MLDHLTETLGLPLSPLTWPVGIPGSFRGVIDRRDETFHQFTRVTGGSAKAIENVVSARGQRDAADRRGLGRRRGGARARRRGRGAASTRGVPARRADPAAVRLGGVELRHRAAAGHAARARAVGASRARSTTARRARSTTPFAALVFKVQANMDPRHRDRVAFMRICSGRFERGMRVNNARTGRTLALSFAHEVFGSGARRARRGLSRRRRRRGRSAATCASATRCYIGPPVRFPAIPTLTPESFVTDLQPRRQPPQAVPPRPRAARPGGRRPRPAPRAHARTPCRCWRASARCSSRSPSSGCGPSSAPRSASSCCRGRPPGAPTPRARPRSSPTPASTDVFVRDDGTQLAVFPNRFVLERFAQRNPTRAPRAADRRRRAGVICKNPLQMRRAGLLVTVMVMFGAFVRARRRQPGSDEERARGDQAPGAEVLQSRRP